jgi:hypothetical protein
MRQLLRTTATVFVALVFTAGMAFGQQTTPSKAAPANNNATVTQNADDSKANINQSITSTKNVGDNIANVKQTGSSQEADIDQVYSQEASSATGEFNFADVVQSDDNQYARIDQNGGRGNRAFLTQEGSGTENEAVIAQGTGELLDGYGDAERALQSGEGNDLTVYQSRRIGEDPTSNSFDEAGVTQTGNDNVGFIEQTGGNGFVAELKQDGNRNDANIDQTGAGQSADVRQLGSDNMADVDQGTGASDRGPKSTVDILQDGAFNEATAFQTGGGGNANMITIDQFGDYNVANVSQNGVGNTATVTQN